jgi:hypothetical protein
MPAPRYRRSRRQSDFGGQLGKRGAGNHDGPVSASTTRRTWPGPLTREAYSAWTGRRRCTSIPSAYFHVGVGIRGGRQQIGAASSCRHRSSLMFID